MHSRYVLTGLALMVAFVALGGCLGGEKVVTRTIVSYQCYDGSVVSKIEDCPQGSGAVTTRTTATTQPSGSNCPSCDCTTTTCPPCVIGGTTTQATTTTIPCDPCTIDSDCGSPYVEYSCKSGDYIRISYTPTCNNDLCCRTQASPYSVSEECGNDEICDPLDGCIPKPND